MVAARKIPDQWKAEDSKSFGVRTVSYQREVVLGRGSPTERPREFLRGLSGYCLLLTELLAYFLLYGVTTGQAGTPPVVQTMRPWIAGLIVPCAVM